MKRVFVALDNMNDKEIFDFLDSYAKELSLIKIGLEVYLKYGREFLKEINQRYCLGIFLDLKLHDIPNTVASAIKSLEGLRIEFLTLHLSAGSSMLTQAKTSRDKYLPETKLIGVSILTSLDESDCLEIYHQGTNEAFKSLLSIAVKTQIDGIVCSGHELSLLDSNNKLIAICPGIRLDVLSPSDDQKRVMTPTEAFKNGADYLVMGRSIRDNPELIKDHSFWSAFKK